jgi:hypothetical protein
MFCVERHTKAHPHKRLKALINHPLNVANPILARGKSSFIVNFMHDIPES